MDRRIRKTKQAIVTAFLELLEEKKDIDKISITDITKRADISRSTFYFHYNGTYELVDEICDSFTKQIYAIVLKAHTDMPGENGYLYMYNEILGYLYENKTTTKLLLMSPKEADMTKKICDDIYKLLTVF
ncbi:MAG: TetR/AcrR family transcriptional regulator [Clostridia bacterium]|nr:TetR/AcrR family transcriptional regulator [Clostridia bacterium]